MSKKCRKAISTFLMTYDNDGFIRHRNEGKVLMGPSLCYVVIRSRLHFVAATLLLRRRRDLDM